uniref:Cytochrome f n=1 Tax=Cyanophora biloba TaxID=1489483 RepID=A0A2Z4HG82_9EUKA|nr:cytochrome f [Cyanophora biloba]AWW13785.1 cytochrome f [Cyanophora biloba]
MKIYKQIKQPFSITKIVFSFFISLLVNLVAQPTICQAYPIYAQSAYQIPREPTGRLVCANCHLGKKPVEIEVPQAVLPDTVFEAVVKIPYEKGTQQIQGNGEKGPLNVGAVLMLPEGFKLAPADRLSEELKAKTSNLYFQPYSPDKENILVIGPIPGDKNQEIIFPILSPNPETNKNVKYLKYQLHVGGNRGRGQVNPTGEKTNNTIYNASISGRIDTITKLESGGYEITITTKKGESKTEIIPSGPTLVVKKGQTINADQPLTIDPNVGGFGQVDAEIVLQSASRIKGLVAFVFSVVLAQIFLVLKKKQFEKVQAAEMNF